jgi:hypothetical protein
VEEPQFQCLLLQLLQQLLLLQLVLVLVLVWGAAVSSVCVQHMHPGTKISGRPK